MENVITTDVAQDIATQEVVPEVKQQDTINDIVQEPAPKETVGLDKYMHEKKSRQAVEKRLAELEAQMASGATRDEIYADVDSIANEYNVDPDFLAKLTKQIESGLDSKIQDKLRPITEEKEKAKFDVTFNERLSNALEQMPEYSKVINPEVIKQLFLLRDNNGKLVHGNISLEQLIENTYVNAIGGKRTLESAQPRGRQEPTDIDTARMQTDGTYYKEVMSNPTLKAKYNSGLADRLSKFI